MKVLIASPDMEASRQLNKTMGRMAPVATYFHADSAERVLRLFHDHRIDLVLLDLRLVAKDSAAATLLRMLNPGALAFTPLEQQLETLSKSPRPGLLLTFDGEDLQKSAASVVSQLQGVKAGAAAGQAPRKVQGATIWAQTEAGDWNSVDVARLQWAVSEDGKVRLHHACGETFFVRDRLKELERQLGPSKFVRIHKSYMVNTRHVSEVQRWSSGGLLLKICDKEQITLPVSRRYASRFRRATGWGIGLVNRSVALGA